MLFEVFLVYFAREHPYMNAIKVVSAARQAYEELEKLEEIKTKEEKSGLEWNQNIDQEKLYKMTLTLGKDDSKKVQNPDECLAFEGRVRITEYPNPDLNNGYSFDIDCAYKIDAERILYAMKEKIKLDGYCTMVNLANFIGMPSSNQLKYFGWRDLSNAKIISIDKTPVEFTLDLPEALFLGLNE